MVPTVGPINLIFVLNRKKIEVLIILWVLVDMFKKEHIVFYLMILYLDIFEVTLLQVFV